jgi:ribose transport system ATP-binding protein
MTPAAPRLVMRDIHKRFGATIALGGVSLTIAPGEIHAIVGENGAGKSTLMKILGGDLHPDSGTMHLDGNPYRPRNPAQGRAAGVAVVYQELSLAPHLNVAENIMLGAEPTIGPFLHRSAFRERAARALAEVGHADIPLDRIMHNLSIGEQQIVEIARAAVLSCRVLVLDEPTSSLPRGDVERLFQMMRRLRSRGVSVLYISHVFEEVAHICDRFTVLRDGVSVGVGDVSATTTRQMIHMMVGRTVNELYPRSPRTHGETVLDVRGLSGLKAPRSAALTVRRGEVVGVAGLIGAGRTELLRAIFGLDEVREGVLTVLHVAGPRSPTRRWRQGCGLVSEDRKGEGLALNLSIADNLTLPRLRPLSRWRLLTRAAQAKASEPWLTRLHAKCQSAAQPVGELSGGNQQKIAFARLLQADADLLLLDEPTRGIDVGAKAEIYQWIDRLVVGDEVNKRKPRAVLMISSYIPELLGVCDRIAVMTRGRLGPLRPAAEVNEHELMRQAIAVGETS